MKCDSAVLQQLKTYLDDGIEGKLGADLHLGVGPPRVNVIKLFCSLPTLRVNKLDRL
jgi:hypothetical protein